MGGIAALNALVLLVVRPSVIPIGGPLFGIALAGIPVGLAETLPLADGLFDLVVMYDVFDVREAWCSRIVVILSKPARAAES